MTKSRLRKIVMHVNEMNWHLEMDGQHAKLHIEVDNEESYS